QAEIDGMAARDGDTLQVLVWNYHDDLVTVPATPVRLRMQLPSSFGAAARVSHLRVDEAHGDAYSAWLSQGQPASPSAAQYAALQQAMGPSPLVPNRTVALAADGSVCLDFELPRFAVSLVTLLPATGTSDLVTQGDDCSDSPESDRAGGIHGNSCACRLGARCHDAEQSRAWLAVA